MSRLWVCHCIAHTKSLLTGRERKVGVTLTVPGRNRADAAGRARQEIADVYSDTWREVRRVDVELVQSVSA